MTRFYCMMKKPIMPLRSHWKGRLYLNFTIPLNEVPFNVIDGFATPEEFKAARGARCWIMAPFANRIPEGKYSVKGKDYQLNTNPA
jgi:galactose mutarotase-like enzyme